MSAKRTKTPPLAAVPAQSLLGPVTVRAIELAKLATRVMREHADLQHDAKAAGLSNPHVESDCGQSLLAASDALWALAVWYAQTEADDEERAAA
jgi:hypothetical protein